LRILDLFDSPFSHPLTRPINDPFSTDEPVVSLFFFVQLTLITSFRPPLLSNTAKMSDQVQELLEVPSEFVKDGVQFVRRCTKRTPLFTLNSVSY
jgi:hypothetical protein